MKYTDRVYGDCEVTEPVILELIDSKSIQRLKKIDQAGYRPLWVKPEADAGEHDYSRFDHSVGVYLLLKRHDAPLAEQIAGLIHDVSHSAFSHCIDYVLEGASGKDQNHQDDIFSVFVKNTEIPLILEKYGFETDRICDDANFPLKENNLPDICADRIDYALRGAIIFGEIGKKESDCLLDSLKTENGRWFFIDAESAKKFAEVFRKMNEVYYAGFKGAIMYRVVGDYLKYALQKGYISESDLYATDDFVIEKIKKHHAEDGKVQNYFDRMNKKTEIINDPNDYEASVFCKSRVVDPLVKCSAELKRFSEIEPGWKEVIRRESQPKRYFLRFLD